MCFLSRKLNCAQLEVCHNPSSRNACALPIVIRQNPGRIETVDFLRPSARHYAVMIVTILRMLSLIPTALRLRSDLALVCVR